MTKEIEVTEGENKYWNEAYAALQDGDKWHAFHFGKELFLYGDDDEENKKVVSYKLGGIDLTIGLLAKDFAQPNFTIKRKQQKPDANGWFTIDSVPIGEKVDVVCDDGHSIIGGTVEIEERGIVMRYWLVSSNGYKMQFYGKRELDSLKWRPATPLPEGY